MSHICNITIMFQGFPGGSEVKNPSGHAQDMGSKEDPLEKEMTTHCSILAWEIPWTEEPVHGVTKELAHLATKQQQGSRFD